MMEVGSHPGPEDMAAKVVTTPTSPAHPVAPQIMVPPAPEVERRPTPRERTIDERPKDCEYEPDSSQKAAAWKKTTKDQEVAEIVLKPKHGKPSLRMAYFFAGKSRKASVGEELRKLCEADGFGLIVYEVDILNGGSAHDLINTESQAAWEARVQSGEFDVIFVTPPCSSWTRALFSDKPGPPPCRDKAHPWGLPGNDGPAKARTDLGNKCIHFSIRLLKAAQVAKKVTGTIVRGLLEHPEDLGVIRHGKHKGRSPASIWQLQDIRCFAIDIPEFKSAAGYQCQFAVDYSKPTRLMSDLPDIEDFGEEGWPEFDVEGRCTGPLTHCGHDYHGTPTYGPDGHGKYNSSDKAAYPAGMCRWLARKVFDDWKSRADVPYGEGRGIKSKIADSNIVVSERKVTFSDVATTAVLAAGNSLNPLTNDGTPSVASTPIRRKGILKAGPKADVRKVEISNGNDGEFEDWPLREGVDSLLRPHHLQDEDDEVPKEHIAEEEATSEEEAEAGGVRRPPRGSGWVGLGQPITGRRKGLPRQIVDGGGLPSPGRWRPEMRRLPNGPILSKVKAALVEGLRSCEKGYPRPEPFAGGCMREELFHVGCGRRLRSPFPPHALEETRNRIREALVGGGYDPGRSRPGDREQAFCVRLIQVLSHLCEDPDSMVCNWWATGTWVGEPGRKLPRTPAIFERKTSWALKPLSGEVASQWQGNYISAIDHYEQVRRQFEAEERRGFMGRLSLEDALARWGCRLRLAALAAIEKKDSVDVRVVYDGTHGVLTNFGIRVRDHVRNPTAVDVKAWLAELARNPGPRFGIAYDVADAHRQVPTVETDWGLLACQLEGTAAETSRRMLEEKLDKAKPTEAGDARVRLRPAPTSFTSEQLKEEVWYNRVGTFGIASAGYWWGRCGALLLRLAYYLTPTVLALWVLLFADDGLSVGQGPYFERALLFHLFLLEVLGTPFKWRKIRGGIQAEWIGYLLDLSRFELGITEARTQWCIRWASDKSRERSVSLQEMREGLGRLCFVSGPLEHLRPLLGPLYAWACRGPRFARRPLPVVLRLILDFLALQLSESHMCGCSEPTKVPGELFRLDAKAEGNEVAIGGWVSKGGQSTREARWFAVRLNPRNAPWAFARGEPFRLIASQNPPVAPGTWCL